MTMRSPHLGVIAAERQATLKAPVNAGLDILALGKKARAFGFTTAYAGPLVRSSFKAQEVAGFEGISIA